MCKYCELKTLNKEIGEKSNNSKLIGELKDGSQVFGAYFNCYAVERDDIHRNQLSLELGVKDGDYVISLAVKNIRIKYCPFCGEKL